MTRERMTRLEAEKVLGLTSAYSCREFNAAYRKAVKANHPDLGGSSSEMVRVNLAKTTIAALFAADKDRVVEPVVVAAWASRPPASEARRPDRPESASGSRTAPVSASSGQRAEARPGKPDPADKTPYAPPPASDQGSSKWTWLERACCWLNCLDGSRLKRAYWPGFVAFLVIYVLAELGAFAWMPDPVSWVFVVMLFPLAIMFQPLLAIVNCFVPVLVPVRFLLVCLLSAADWVYRRVVRA